MNKQRRSRIRIICENLNQLPQETDKAKLLERCNDIKSEIDDVQYDEEDAFDNMPENLQYSMRGEESQDAIDSMQNASDALDELSEDSNIDDIYKAIDIAEDEISDII